MAYDYGFQTPCWEIDGSPVEVGTLDNFRATVSLRCAWGDRYSLAAEQAAFLLYPRLPGTLARCKSITIRPYTKCQGADSYGGTYEDALVVSEYVWDRRSPQQDQNGDLFSESLEPTAEHLTLDPSCFQWSDGTPLDQNEAPGLLIRGLDYVLTHYNLSAIPAAALTLVGCVNEATVSSYTLGISFPAQTLLFNPPTCQRKVMMGPSPNLTWTVTYRFTYKACGWNQFWNARGQKFDTLKAYDAASQTYTSYTQYTPSAFTGF
ncbi:MAG: hypothetical protein ACLQNE_43580 [Thermoguttaceae bacterium]|jgi:hypothetical protein